jgi:hypothetical protein
MEAIVCGGRGSDKKQRREDRRDKQRKRQSPPPLETLEFIGGARNHR